MTPTVKVIDTATLAQLSRALIGFDRIFNNIESRNSSSNYPPYNILKYDENNYEIEIAVAGYDRDEIEVLVDQDQLIIRGDRRKDEDPSLYIHRGLASRAFEKSFTLPQYMEVVNVGLTNGILYVKLLLEVPETLKPRILKIQ
jgi:molecular chaperone IbpA